MSLDNFSDNNQELPKKTESNALELFKDSALFELHQSAFGLAQTVGLENHLAKMDEPAAADSALGRNVQMIGRGVGSFLPTIAVAAASKFALGRVLEAPAAGAAEKFYLKQSAIGLNLAEAGVTGAATGSLLKPTDEAAAKDWGSFLKDRAVSGFSSALSFEALTLTTFGINRVAGSQIFKSQGAENVIKFAPVNGFVSGAAGGVINVELNSLVNDRRLTFDGDKIYNSAYESAVVGGLFGATTLGLSKLRSAGETKVPSEQTTAPAVSAPHGVKDLKAFSPAGLRQSDHQSLFMDEPDHHDWVPVPDHTALHELLVKTALDAKLAKFKDNLIHESYYEKLPSPMPGMMGKILSHEKNIPSHWNAAEPTYYKKGFEAAAKVSSASDSYFAKSKEESVAKLKQVFGDDSPYVVKLEELGSKHSYPFSLGSLASYVKESPEIGKAMIEKLIDDNAPVAKIEADRLKVSSC